MRATSSGRATTSGSSTRAGGGFAPGNARTSGEPGVQRARVRSGGDEVPVMTRLVAGVVVALALVAAPEGGPAAAQQPAKVFISVDMEGIGGIGTAAMTSAAGKDYATGRRLMTDEVNAVVAAIFARGPAEVLVN